MTSLLKIEELLSKMKHPSSGLTIQDRTHHLRSYKQCFVGSEYVDWLMKHARGLVTTKEQAIQVGQEFMNKGIIHHSSNQQPFIDGYQFYFFQKAIYSGYMGKLSKSGTVWKMRWFTLRDIKENRLWYFTSLRDPVPKNFIPLVDCFIRVYDDDEVGYLEITIPSRIYKLRAASQHGLNKWVKHLFVHTQDIHDDNSLIEEADKEIIDYEYQITTIALNNFELDLQDEAIYQRNNHSLTSSYNPSFASAASGSSINTNINSTIITQLNNNNNNNVSEPQSEPPHTIVDISKTSTDSIKRSGWIERSGVQNDLFIKNSV